jgi:hypothetical protein
MGRMVRWNCVITPAHSVIVLGPVGKPSPNSNGLATFWAYFPLQVSLLPHRPATARGQPLPSYSACRIHAVIQKCKFCSIHAGRPDMPAGYWGMKPFVAIWGIVSLAVLL